MDPAGREKARYGDRSHHGFVGIGKISRIFFNGAIFSDILPASLREPGLRVGDVQVGSGLRGNP